MNMEFVLSYLLILLSFAKIHHYHYRLLQLIDSTVRVKCLGGRELRGSLRGYDELVNLVLDDCDEFLRGS
jgi:hypothetical protein